MKTTTTGRRLCDSYFDLVRGFPLVPIRDERHYDAAVSLMNQLAIRGEDGLDSGEQAYLDALTQFVSHYERDRHAIQTSDLSPLDALRYLMDASDMSPADLGRVLGNRSLASQILLGKRDLSKTQILKISGHFQVEPGLFLQ